MVFSPVASWPQCLNLGGPLTQKSRIASSRKVDGWDPDVHREPHAPHGSGVAEKEAPRLKLEVSAEIRRCVVQKL